MRKATMRAAALLGALAAIGAVAGWASTAQGSGKAGFTLRIGNVIPLTGDSSVFGPAYAKAAGLAVQQATKALRAAGVRDVKIQIEHADDQTTPDGAVAAARKVISNGADCVLGSIPSANTIAIAQAATVPAGIPQIAPSSSSPAITNLDDNGLVFRVMPSDVLQAPVLAKMIAQEEGTRVLLSLAGRNDAFGQGLLPRLKTAWEKLGGKALGPVFYDPGAAIYNAEADEITKGNPDFYVILDFPRTYAKVAAALLRTGKFSGRKLFVAGGWPATIPDFIPAAGLEGARGTRPGSLTGTKAYQAFDELFKTTPGVKDHQTLDLNNFDAAMLCILAAVAAGSSSPKEIAKNIQKVASAPGKPYTFLTLTQAIRDLRAGKDINYQGVGGTVDLDQNGDLKGALYDVFKYVDGKQVVQRQIRIRR